MQSRTKKEIFIVSDKYHQILLKQKHEGSPRQITVFPHPCKIPRA